MPSRDPDPAYPSGRRPNAGVCPGNRRQLRYPPTHPGWPQTAAEPRKPQTPTPSGTGTDPGAFVDYIRALAGRQPQNCRLRARVRPLRGTYRHTNARARDAYLRVIRIPPTRRQTPNAGVCPGRVTQKASCDYPPIRDNATPSTPSGTGAPWRFRGLHPRRVLDASPTRELPVVSASPSLARDVPAPRQPHSSSPRTRSHVIRCPGQVAKAASPPPSPRPWRPFS